MALMQDTYSTVSCGINVCKVSKYFPLAILNICLVGLCVRSMEWVWTSECNINMSAKKFASVGGVNYVHQMVLYKRIFFSTLLYSTDIAMNALTFLTGYVKNGQNVF